MATQTIDATLFACFRTYYFCGDDAGGHSYFRIYF
jgi:hypothetical protein